MDGRARHFIFDLSVLFLAVFCAKWLHKAGSNPTNLVSAKLCRSAGWTGGGPHLVLASSTDVIVSKLALLEA